MYTSSAAQHLRSQALLVHHLPHSSPKGFAFKSSSSVLAILNRNMVPPLVSDFFLPCSLWEAAQPRVAGASWKGIAPALRALGYNAGEDDDDDDDNVYVRSFRPSRSFPDESRMGERNRHNNGRDQGRDSASDSGERRSYQRGSTSAQGERPGFRAELRGGSEGGSSDCRDSFLRGERAEGEDVASSRSGGRGQWSNRGGRGVGQGRGSGSQGRGTEARGNASNGERPKNGLILDEAIQEMVEYRHPDWKKDPKAARKVPETRDLGEAVGFGAAELFAAIFGTIRR